MSETESLLEFPCDFPIKVLGLDDGNFENLVVTLIREQVPDLGEAVVRCRPSQGGKYLAVTVTLRATSQEQLDTLYRALSGRKDILMVL